MSRVLWCVMLCGVWGASTAHAAPLRWEDVFHIRSSTQAVHFKASYVDGNGRSHTLEEWRDGVKRVRRVTDQTGVAVYMTKGDGKTKKDGGGARYEVVDYAHKIRYGVSQTNLHLLGLFIDSDQMVTTLSRPTTEYTLVVSARKAQKTAVGPCQWYRVDSAKNGVIQEICWSKTWGLPLLVERPDGKDGKARKTVFTIAEVSANPPAETFDVKERDFAFIDADQDLGNDD